MIDELTYSECCQLNYIIEKIIKVLNMEVEGFRKKSYEEKHDSILHAIPSMVPIDEKHNEVLMMLQNKPDLVSNHVSAYLRTH